MWLRILSVYIGLDSRVADNWYWPIVGGLRYIISLAKIVAYIYYYAYHYPLMTLGIKSYEMYVCRVSVDCTTAFNLRLYAFLFSSFFEGFPYSFTDGVIVFKAVN